MATLRSGQDREEDDDDHRHRAEEEDEEEGGCRSPPRSTSTPWPGGGGGAGVEAGAASRRRKCFNASMWLKLSIVVGLLVVVSTGVLAVVMWVFADHGLVSEIQRRLTTVAALRSEQLDSYLSGEREKIDLVANRVQILSFLSGGDVTSSAALEDLEAALSSVIDINSAAVYDRNGSMSFSTNTAKMNRFEPTLSAGEVPDVANGSVKISLPVREGSGWTYNLTRPMIKDGELVGVLVAWLNATKLQGIVDDRTGLQNTGELLVGVPLNRTHVRLLLPPVSNPDLTIIPLSPAMSYALHNQTGFREQRDYRGRKVVVAYTPLRVANWALQAKVERSETYRPVRNLRVSILIIIFATLAFGVLCSLVVARLFIAPIIDLSRVATALGRGDMTARVKDDRRWCRDEIDDLRHTFNAMADQIASHNSNMEQKVAERTRELARINVELARINDSLKVQIEERKRIETELEKAKNIAVSADRSKSEFLANMSHEIRTPLNGIINCTELCLDTQTSAEQQEYLDLVRFSAKHLLRIITDILDFSKIEAGKLEMEEIQFSLYDQLEHAVSVLAARAHKKGLELACGVSRDVPDQIIGDPGRLFQVFVNLIGNSIKFTSEGEVVVSASVENTTGDRVELLFAVKDTGIGIPQSKQSSLFQAFSQVEASTTRVYGGTGLGLVISSKLAAAMGGRMWVHSEGKGSTFYFSATFQIPPACELPLSLTVDRMKDVPVLVVDDNETSQSILVDTLQTWGMVAVGVDGVDAAKTVLESAVNAGKQFKVLLLDLWLQRPTDAPEFVQYLHDNPHLLGSRNRTKVVDVSQLDQEVVRNANQESDDVDPELPLCLRRAQGDDLVQGEAVTTKPLCTEHITGTATAQEHNATNGQDPSKRGNGKVQPRRIEGEQVHGNLPKKMEDVSSLHRNLRSVSIGGKALSIVMLTSVDHPDAAKCKQLGIEIHTSKPIKRALLVRALNAALGVFNGQEAASVGDAARSSEGVKSKGLHILVAEDNIVNQRVAMKLLQKWGHTTVLACNGQEAVDKALEEHFDLILMDVQMPILDGLQATTCIREGEKRKGSTSRIPIVAMTAHAMTGDGERCMAAGMDDYVSKPLNAKKLEQLLQNVASGHVVQRSRHSSTGSGHNDPS